MEVRVDNGYVYLRLPANIKQKNVPSILFSAHLDTTPDAPAPKAGFVPQIIERYNGEEIRIGDKLTLDTIQEQQLKQCLGHKLIFARGDSYLGGDCRSGVAIVMQLFETLAANPKIQHGDVYGLICPNEDIGQAADGIKWEQNIPDLVYDLDGGGREIIGSNFTAAQYTITFHGNLEHPSLAADNGFADALNAAARFIANLSAATTPENSRGRSGYIHPWRLTMKEKGAVAEVLVRLRYFSKEEGDLLQSLITDALKQCALTNPRVKIDPVFVKQYANVEESMNSQCLKYALDAYKACGITDAAPIALRAGITAAMFPISSPLPGGVCLGTGQHREHSLYEYLSVDEMAKAYDIALEIVKGVAK